VPVTWEQQAKQGKTNEGNKEEHQIQSVRGFNKNQQVIVFVACLIKRNMTAAPPCI